MSLPIGASRLNWIQSTGTQYLDTQFQPNSNTKVVIDFQAENFSRNIFGARKGWKNDAFALHWNDAGTSAVQINDSAIAIAASYTDFLRHTVEMTASSLTIDGSVAASYSSGTFETGKSMYIALANGAESDGFWQGKIYSCQIYDNGTLVRDYIPCKLADGSVGLWDDVEGKLYGNAGTGTFIAGPVKITTPKAPGNFRVVSETDTEVALAWDAAENATGYRLYKNGALLADTTELAYTDTAEPFGAYTYHVNAYNEFGEGEAAELVVFLSPDNPILWLVTDRTQADVTARNSKGVYRAVDLNRVGAALKYLRRRLLDAGILADVSPRMDWTDTMWMSASEARVYLNNVKAMRAALAMPKGTPAAPDDLAKLTYAEANHMEMFLVILDTLLTDMVFAYRHCGTTVCGMGGLIL